MGKTGLITLSAILSVIILGSIVYPVRAPPVYSASASPFTISSSESTSIRVQLAGGTPSTSYSFDVVVTKPSSAGQSTASLGFTTDTTGYGAVSATYPSSSFTPSTGTVATDISGVYSVRVDQTSPTLITGVASTSFTVTYTLIVTMVSPLPSASFPRNTLVNITAQVKYVDQRPVPSASALANTPGGPVTLLPTIPGTYTSIYKLQLSDSTGPWLVRVNATDGSNRGTNSVTVTVALATLTIFDLVTRNDAGSPTSVFYLGDTFYPSFRIGYSGGGFLTSGSYRIQIRSPTGATVTTLLCNYDPVADLFSTSSGYTVSNSDPDGAWQLAFPASSLSDAYGNTGPNALTQFKFTVHTASTDPLATSSQYLLIAAMAVASGVTGTLAFRRFNTSKVPFEHLFKLTGGELQPPTTLMMIEDPGSGAGTLALQLVHRELVAGRSCGIISYQAFPSAVVGKMREMGWDPAKYVEYGNLKIIDCYSAVAGIEGGSIKDPTDFTEVSIQANSIMEKAKGPFTLLLDSVTPIFNGAEAKACVRFLQALGARVKSKGGTFILTATKGSLSEEVRTQIEGMADGVIELSLVRKGKNLARFVMVKKISERQVSSAETEFEIVHGKGIIFKKQRVPIGTLM